MKRKIFGSIILAAITLGISAPAVNAATETNDTQAVAISDKGTTAYNAHVRIGFKGSLNIGVSSVNVTIQSFNKSATIYCNAAGKYSASWN